MYDVIIIGGGVIGAAAARELSRYQAAICVIEKEEDVCCGTSKANSGIVHAGYDAAPGTWKARLNVRGNQLMGKLAEELDFPFERRGSLVVCRDEEGRSGLMELYERGLKNKVEGLQILSGEEARALEPNLSEEVQAALYAPTAGIVCPFGLNIALAENAYTNGVEFKFNTAVDHIRKVEGGYEVRAGEKVFLTHCIVNAAGVYGDRFHNMVSEKKIHITARKGEYCLLDKGAGVHVKRTIFALPGKMGKGILVTPTVHGNLLLGPTAENVEDKEDCGTTGAGLDRVLEKSGENVRGLPLRQVITSFAGLRAHEDGGDFLIGEVEDAPGFIDCAGIESPGLTSCPAIGEMVAQIVSKKLSLKHKKEFIAVRRGILNPQTLPPEERNRLIRREPAYGNVICRCERITEGEILDAIRRPLGAKSLDGVKRRTRAGMGRCQSGFCSPRVMEILAKELGEDLSRVTKCGPGSALLSGENKDRLKEGGEGK